MHSSEHTPSGPRWTRLYLHTGEQARRRRKCAQRPRLRVRFGDGGERVDGGAEQLEVAERAVALRAQLAQRLGEAQLVVLLQAVDTLNESGSDEEGGGARSPACARTPSRT